MVQGQQYAQMSIPSASHNHHHHTTTWGTTVYDIHVITTKIESFTTVNIVKMMNKL
jgi:hypothetical protein